MRQQVRVAVRVLAALTLIAAFGVFGASLAGGQSLQTSIIEWVPIEPRVFGWATHAVPLAGVFGLLALTPLRIVRAVLSLLLLVPGVLVMAVMSKPWGVPDSQWAIDPAFARAQETTTYALMGALFLWAFVAAVVVARSRDEDVVLKLRRSVLWAGPLTIAASFVFALSIS